MNANSYSRFFNIVRAVMVLTALSVTINAAAALSPTLKQSLPSLSNSASAGVVIVSFKTSTGLTDSHLGILRSIGVLNGVTFPKLGMVGANVTAGQVRSLLNDPNVQSIWSNDQLRYYMNQARIVTGVDKVQSDVGFTIRNGGYRVSGNGDFSVLVIDTGIDATHADLPYGSKVIQNSQRVVGTTSTGTITVAGVPVQGFVPAQSIEGLQNTDNVGHGTHCAGIVGGLGARSNGIYAGVAPGAKIVGSGGGAVIVVLSALAGWEYGFEHADLYHIRVVSNSYGPIGGGAFNPNDPTMIAAKKAHDVYNMTVLFAAGNDGSAKGTLSPYAQAPWVIGVAAGTKEGMLASFSSRGIPKAERIGNQDPTDDLSAPTITAPGTGRYFGDSVTASENAFTSDIVSVRASGNLTANGTWYSNTGADTEIPTTLIPFYTEISGTSMATPFTAGVVALMLDADPSLTPDEIKQIISDTATKMPGYDDFEVGSGFLNAYAAVDKVFNRTKGYKNFADQTFNARFSEERPPEVDFTINYDPSQSGATSVNSHNFEVAADMSVLDVWAQTDTEIDEDTGNVVGIAVYDPNGKRYGSTSIPMPVIGTDVRETVVNNPMPGTWRVEVKGACGTTVGSTLVCSPQQLAAPGPVDVKINQVKYILPVIPDIENSPDKDSVIFALKNRLIDIYADGTFQPDQIVTREDLARSLVLNTPLRQSLANSTRFSDVSGDFSRIAEAVTSSGSTLRDYGFASTPIMSYSGNAFNPSGTVNRLDLAVAFVKALGHDAKAKALAGQPVMVNGTELSDDAQIPAEMRGYVQIAINDGMFEAFPAEIRQVAPGQWMAVPGPRFEPATGVSRGQLAVRLAKFHNLFTTGG